MKTFRFAASLVMLLALSSNAFAMRKWPGAHPESWPVFEVALSELEQGHFVNASNREDLSHGLGSRNILSAFTNASNDYEQFVKNLNDRMNESVPRTTKIEIIDCSDSPYMAGVSVCVLLTWSGGTRKAALAQNGFNGY